MTTSNYAWIIDRDRLAEEEGPQYQLDNPSPCNDNAVGMTGPRNIGDNDLDALMTGGKGQRFRILDDDDEVYYEGRIILAASAMNGEEMFGPLDDFGAPNAGCTSIQYWEAGTGGGWKTL